MLAYMFFLILCVISSCCERKSSSDIIKVEFGNPIENFTSLIESVEFIPLETDSLHILGYQTWLLLNGNDYIIFDKRHSYIYSYDFVGKFVSEIGKKGNGPGEYLEIISVQLYQDSLIVYSMPDKEISYDRQGGAKEKRIGMEIVQSAFKTKDGILHYYGYGKILPYRLSLIKDGIEIKKFLYDEYNQKVMEVGMSHPIFSADEEGIYLIDSFNPNILLYKEGEISEFLCLDFGKYRIPEKYFKFDDPYQAVDYLGTIDGATVSYFCKDGEDMIVGINYGGPGRDGGMNYGIYRGGKWTWFGIKGDQWNNPHPLSYTFRNFKNGFMYFLIPANLVADIPEQIMLLATNPDAIKDLKEDDNYVITKIKLK